MTAGANDYAPDRKFQVQVFEEYDVLTEAARISSLIDHFKREIYYVAVFCNDGIKIMLCSGYRYDTCFALLAKTLMLQKGSCPKGNTPSRFQAEPYCQARRKEGCAD